MAYGPTRWTTALFLAYGPAYGPAALFLAYGPFVAHGPKIAHAPVCLPTALFLAYALQIANQFNSQTRTRQGSRNRGFGKSRYHAFSPDSSIGIS